MPTISVFYGIVIQMYWRDHNPPHFHAYYQENTAVFSISPIALIAGYLPQKQQRLVEAWGELHEDELKADWEKLLLGEPPSSIKPLE